MGVFMFRVTNAWAEEHNDKLRELHSTGMSCSQIAVALNRLFGLNKTRNSIIGRLHRMGLTGHKNYVNPNRVRPRSAAPRPRPAPKPAKPKGEPPRPLPAELARIAALEPTGPTIEHTDAKHCRYIKGEPSSPVCGRPIHADSLCAEHHRLCWLPNKKRASPPPFMLRSLRCEAPK